MSYLPLRVAARYMKAAFFNVGDIIFYGKYKNKKGRVVRFSENEKGQPLVEIEPIPKGRKKNKVIGLFKIWSGRAMEEAKAQKEDLPEPIPPKTAEDLNMTIAERVARTWALKQAGLSIGGTVELGKIRIHRYATSLWVTDLTNAGMRGKKVRQLTLSTSYKYQGDSGKWLDNMSKALMDYKSYDRVVAFIKDLQHDFPGEIEMNESQERGVDITPAGFQELKIITKTLRVEVDYHGFTVQDVKDQNNLPTCIPAIKGGKKSIPVFYRWVKDNESKIKQMSYVDVKRQMDSLDIKYHQFCAMD